MTDFEQAVVDALERIENRLAAIEVNSGYPERRAKAEASVMGSSLLKIRNPSGEENSGT